MASNPLRAVELFLCRAVFFSMGRAKNALRRSSSRVVSSGAMPWPVIWRKPGDWAADDMEDTIDVVADLSFER